MRKAYSYLRFSTPEQSKGDSYRRQIEATREYAILNDLDLDQSLSFHDLGISAYKGRNANKGQLGDFLRAVQEGMVKRGSVLLVESLDRISRQTAWRAIHTLRGIVIEDVSVITLSDRREYTIENFDTDPFALLSAILIFIRANEESEIKSKRLKSSWAGKRLKIHEKPMTSRGPAWLSYDKETNQWCVNEYRKTIIQRIFNEADNGTGEHFIAKGLNTDHIPTWGDQGREPAVMWHRSYVAKILRSQSVIGTLVPFTSETKNEKTKRVALTIVPNYYPAIIDMSLWERVQSIKSSRSPMRGAHSGQPIQNVLGGLAKCWKCGSTMTRINKGRRQPIPKLLCTKAKSGAGCDYLAISLDVIEDALKSHFKHQYKAQDVDTVREFNKDMIAEYEAEYVSVSEQIDALMKNRELMKFDETQKEVAELLEKKQELAATKEFRYGFTRLLTDGFYAERCNELTRLLKETDIDRSSINIVLRQIYTKAVVNQEEEQLELHTRFGVVAEVPYEKVLTEDRLRSSVSRATRDDRGRFIRH